jgi:hypothetical protein
LRHPLRRPDNWLDWVNQSQNEAELAALRTSIQSGVPFRIAISSFQKTPMERARQRIEKEHYHMIILKNGPKSKLRMLKENNSRMISAAV